MVTNTRTQESRNNMYTKRAYETLSYAPSLMRSCIFNTYHIEYVCVYTGYIFSNRI